MAPPYGSPDGSAPPPSDERARTAALYAAHWRYVRRLLPSYGVPTDAQKDVAQAVWMTAHERIASYDAATHKTPRAWLTGIVRRCAANYRRMLKRRPEDPTEDAGALVAAPGLDPEQAALLGTLRQAIRDPERCEAFILRVHEGLSIEEIAAATGATESAVERRLRMAKQDLEDDDDTKKSRGFLGFGSLEALTEALRPKPIPDEVGEEDWKEIARRIDNGERPDITDSEPPPSSLPPPSPAVPAIAPSGAPAAATALTKGTVGGLVAVAFIVGALSGGLLARQPHERPPSVPMEEACLAPTAPPDAATSRGSTSTPASGASTKATPASGASTRATPAGSVALPSAATASPSLRLILQMRHAAEIGNFAAVLAFADEHARSYPATDVTERERERRKALEQLDRDAAVGRSAP